MSATLTPDRLTAVDLTDLPTDNMSALRREAIRRGISLSELVATLVNEASQRLVSSQSHHVTATDIISGAVAARDPEGRAAYASGHGLATTKPEGTN